MLVSEGSFLGLAMRKLLGEGEQSEVRVRDGSGCTVESTDTEKNKHLQPKHFLLGMRGGARRGAAPLFEACAATLIVFRRLGRGELAGRRQAFKIPTSPSNKKKQKKKGKKKEATVPFIMRSVSPPPPSQPVYSPLRLTGSQLRRVGWKEPSRV